MYCPNCGREIPDGSKFCPYCGTKLVLPAKSRAKVPKVGRVGGKSSTITRIVGRLGGVLIVLSALFLPWYRFPLMGNGKILDLLDLAESSGERTLIILTFMLVLIGGFIAIFKPKIGGVIAIIGLLFSFSIAAMIASGGDFGKNAIAFDFLDSGHYVAWIGVAFCFFSRIIAKVFSGTS